MPLDNVASLLDFLIGQKLVSPERLNRSELEQGDVKQALENLKNEGLLTFFQVEKILAGQGEELIFGEYQAISEFPGITPGVGYHTIHRETRQSAVVHCRSLISPETLDLGRFEPIINLKHPFLLELIHVGIKGHWFYQVIEEPKGLSLETLVKDIGPMPHSLAIDYSRQVAIALQQAHDLGCYHDDLRPCHLYVGPLVPGSKKKSDGTPILRPTPTAIIRLAQLAFGSLVRQNPDPYALEYVPPEYSPSSSPNAASDVFMLGSTIYFMLTGHTPHVAKPLKILRPDAPMVFTTLVHEMMSVNPADRPVLPRVIELLTNLMPGSDTKPTGVQALNADDPALVTLESPDQHPDVPHDFVPDDNSTQHLLPEDWTSQPAGSGDVVPEEHAGTEPGKTGVAKRQQPSRMSRQKMYMWIGIGLLLNLIGLVVIYFAFVAGDSETKPNPTSNPNPKKRSVS